MLKSGGSVVVGPAVTKNQIRQNTTSLRSISLCHTCCGICQSPIRYSFGRIGFLIGTISCCANHNSAPAPSSNEAYLPPLRNNGSILHHEASVHAGAPAILHAVDICNDRVVLKRFNLVLDIKRK